MLLDWWASLRGAHALPTDVRTFGRPHIVNDGRLELGRGITFVSWPIRAHLTIGRGALLRIGARVVVASGSGIDTCTEIEIEDDVIIGPFVTIMDSDFHGVGARDRAAESRPIRIGRGVRLGAAVVVLRGVTIGRGAEIEPGSVVSRSVPPGGHFGGVPARAVPIGAAPLRATISDALLRASG